MQEPVVRQHQVISVAHAETVGSVGESEELVVLQAVANGDDINMQFSADEQAASAFFLEKHLRECSRI